MKSLLLVRHAKSSWDSPTMKDFDRPLNDRGQKDAPLMAERLLQKEINIDAFVTSTAIRALTTAQCFHKVYKAAHTSLIPIAELYHAQPTNFIKVINNLQENWKSVAIFSHNPGITEMVNNFGVATVADMPTCAVFGVTANVKHWKDFNTAEKRFLLFDYPKIIR